MLCLWLYNELLSRLHWALFQFSTKPCCHRKPRFLHRLIYFQDWVWLEKLYLPQWFLRAGENPFNFSILSTIPTIWWFIYIWESLLDHLVSCIILLFMTGVQFKWQIIAGEKLLPLLNQWNCTIKELSVGSLKISSFEIRFNPFQTSNKRTKR